MSACPAEPDFLRRYPSQLSVGQAQRVLIAMAVLHRPALLIADEPTSALDLITQAEILQLFASLSAKFGISILYISHDLLSVATIAHRVAVMHQGEIVECRRTAELFQEPEHPYTRQLIRALPVIPDGLQRQAAFLGPSALSLLKVKSQSRHLPALAGIAVGAAISTESGVVQAAFPSASSRRSIVIFILPRSTSISR